MDVTFSVCIVLLFKIGIVVALNRNVINLEHFINRVTIEEILKHGIYLHPDRVSKTCLVITTYHLQLQVHK